MYVLQIHTYLIRLVITSCYMWWLSISFALLHTTVLVVVVAAVQIRSFIRCWAPIWYIEIDCSIALMCGGASVAWPLPSQMMTDSWLSKSCHHQPTCWHDEGLIKNDRGCRAHRLDLAETCQAPDVLRGAADEVPATNSLTFTQWESYCEKCVRSTLCQGLSCYQDRRRARLRTQEGPKVHRKMSQNFKRLLNVCQIITGTA